MHQHRSGKLKQSNKKHKATSLSKRERKRVTRGRTEGRKRRSVKASCKGLQKQKRDNAARQKRQMGRERLISDRRATGGFDAPKNVMFLGLDAEADLGAVRDALTTTANGKIEVTGLGHTCMVATKPKKQRFMLMKTKRTILDFLDGAKVADVMVIVFRASAGVDNCIDDFGHLALTSARSQGMPAVISVVQGLHSLKPKAASEMRKYAQRVFRSEFGKDVPIVESEHPFQMLRALANIRPRVLKWRQMRPYLLAHQVSVCPEPGHESQMCQVHVTGYLRGPPLDPSAPVHLTGIAGGDGGGGDGFGSYVIRRAEQLPDPFAHQGRGSSAAVVAEADPTTVTPEAVARRTQAEAEEDLNANGEQTWPTEAEMGGMEDDDDDDDDADDADDAAVMDTDTGAAATKEMDGSGDEEEEEDEWKMWMKAAGDKKAAAGEDGSDAESMTEADEAEARAERAALLREEQDEREFPDEVDTPRDDPASERFARYRGLKSFRTSPWDPLESLPQDYAKIFRFEGGFARMQRHMERLNKGLYSALKESDSVATGKKKKEGVDATAAPRGQTLLENRLQPGMLVRFVLGMVPAAQAKQVAIAAGASGAAGSRTLILSGLLPHEQRLSVLHWTVARQSDYVEPIKSKQRFMFQCGFRRFSVRPIFSEAEGARAAEGTVGKYKFHRFLQPSGFTVASAFAPVTYAPAPLLMFTEGGTLVGTGSLLDAGRGVDPDRIVLKRVILTGYPSRVHKFNATVVRMFFNADDINWFKPIELRTKYGLTGQIRDSIGTHGHMKCMFNKAITQNDTVCLQLYKRCYSKWVGSETSAPLLLGSESAEAMAS